MQVCIKKRRFIRLFFWGANGKGRRRRPWREEELLAAALYPSESSPPNPRRNQNERHSRFLLPFFSPTALLSRRFLFSGEGNEGRGNKVKRLEGADVRHLPAFISFYFEHPPSPSNGLATIKRRLCKRRWILFLITLRLIPCVGIASMHHSNRLFHRGNKLRNCRKYLSDWLEKKKKKGKAHFRLTDREQFDGLFIHFCCAKGLEEFK